MKLGKTAKYFFLPFGEKARYVETADCAGRRLAFFGPVKVGEKARYN
jgi:hypothetical protein